MTILVAEDDFKGQLDALQKKEGNSQPGKLRNHHN